jgi:hypothetical protein
MNTLMASLLFGTTAVATAQFSGQVDFANFYPADVNAPISDASSNRIIGPSPYVTDLFWSMNTNASMDSFTAVDRNTPFSTATNNGGGYFFGGAVRFYWTPILAQVRAWDTNYGSTYYEARDNGGEFGFSNFIIVTPANPLDLPAPLTGLQSFQLQRLPSLSVSYTTTNTLQFSWPVEVTSYSLQQNRGFDAANWVTLTNLPVLVGAQNEVIIPKPQESAFYRLISQ